MANIYLKKVSSSSRSEWNSGTSYVAGDRVYLLSASIENVFDSPHPSAGDTFSAFRTFVCLADNSSTISPEDDTENWIEAGTSKEYPYHCIDGALDSSNTNNEIYLETEASRYLNGNLITATYYHLRRGETEYSLGKLIIVSDTEDNPVFTINKNSTFIGFSMEPDASIERFTIVCFNNALIGSNSQHNDAASRHAKIIKCDIYYSGNNTGGRLVGGIYANMSKVEFIDCLFSEQGSKVGYSDCTSASMGFGHRNFVGFKRCSFFFPSIPYKDNLVYDPQAHSNTQQSFIESCSMWFQSFSQTQLLVSTKPGTLFKNNVFYFSTSSGQEIMINYSSVNSIDDSANNVLYIADNSATFNFTNTGNATHDSEYYSDRFIITDPLYVLNADDPAGLQLRPSSPLIGGLLTTGNTQRYQIESEYPQGKWFDSNAGDGGDGSWDAPYNNYALAINSFTGDEAVVLIKKGQHQLRRGYWNGSAWWYDTDLPKSYPDGIKFIGMGPDTIFTTDSDVKGYGAFFISSQGGDNLTDTPFTFKNLDFLLNHTSTMGRGLVCAYKIELVNVNVSQAPNLGVLISNLFDYTMSPSLDSGHYLKMSNCTVNVSHSSLSNGTNFLVGGNGGKKQFKGCTFADLDRTASRSDPPGGSTQWSSAAPESFMHHDFGAFGDSYLHDCIFYSETSTTFRFGTVSTQASAQGRPSLEIKNSVIFSTQVPLSIGSNFADSIKELDPRFVATDPDDYDLRLRPDSPVIGGISKSKYSADTIWVSAESAGTGTGTESDPFHFNGDANSQFLDAVNAAVNNGTFEVVFKDGDYRMTTGGEQLQAPNLGLVTLVAENKDKAVLSAQREVNIGALNSQTIKLKGFKVTITGSEHFIHTQYISNPFHLHLDNCYFLVGSFMSMSADSTITAKNCIFEKKLGTNIWIYSGSGQSSFTNCLFLDRNLNGTYKFNHNTTQSVFKNCIFRSEQPNNPSIPALGNLIKCAVYNYNTDNYSEEEVVFDGDPLMIYFDPTSHENSNYNLRPLSPLIGQG